MNVMKKLLMATAAVALTATTAFAERYVMITHTQGTDPFWPVVEKGARDAGAHVGAEIEYNFDVSGDMAAMAKLIEAAAASASRPPFSTTGQNGSVPWVCVIMT